MYSQGHARLTRFKHIEIQKLLDLKKVSNNNFVIITTQKVKAETQRSTHFVSSDGDIKRIRK